MNWSRLLVFMLLTIGLAGSTASLIIGGMIKFEKVKNPYLIIVFLQTALMLYIVPVLFVGVVADRINPFYSSKGWRIGTDGVFLTSHLNGIDQIGILAGMIWGAGCLCKAIGFGRERIALKRALRKNRCVSNRGLRKVTEEYRIQFRLRKLALYENETLRSPISLKDRGYMVVLPPKAYSDKEYRMILEHECNHIGRKDLLWRKMVIAAECINWYNPLVKRLSRQLIYYQEVCCDLQSISSRDFFTPKEYGAFLASLSDSGFSHMPLTSFRESKSMLAGRLKMMTQAKQMKKVSKKFMFTGVTGFIAVSLLPADAVSAQVIRVGEQMIYASEAVTQLLPDKQKILEEKVEYGRNDVKEVYISEDSKGSSDMFGIDIDISGNTRSLLDLREVEAGSRIWIAIHWKTDDFCKVGIKNESTGEGFYVEGKAIVNHEFKFAENGKYSLYVENESGQTVSITGCAVYQD